MPTWLSCADEARERIPATDARGISTAGRAPINSKKGPIGSMSACFLNCKMRVKQPGAIDYALQEFERQLAASFTELSDQTKSMRQRSEQIRQELRNLVSTVASCGPSPALVTAVNEREQELQAITRHLLSDETGSVSSQVTNMRQFVTERLGEIRQLLRADVRKARAELAKHVSGIQMDPQPSEKKGHYIAVGQWDLLGGYGEGSRPCPTEMRVRMVAGEGFEPSTFGL